MRIRKPRGLTTTQLMVTTVIGAIGGVYIYKPLFLENRKKGSLHNNNIEPTEPAAVAKLIKPKEEDQSVVAK